MFFLKFTKKIFFDPFNKVFRKAFGSKETVIRSRSYSEENFFFFFCLRHTNKFNKAETQKFFDAKMEC